MTLAFCKLRERPIPPRLLKMPSPCRFVNSHSSLFVTEVPRNSVLKTR